MTEEERAAVREEAIRDPDTEAEIREIELDLLDAAARGTLDPDRRQRVETYLASATHNRDGWQLARALAEREARAASPAGAPGRLRDAARLREVAAAGAGARDSRAAAAGAQERDGRVAARGRAGMPPEVSRVNSRWFVGWQAAAAVIIAAAGLMFYLRGTPSVPDSAVPGARSAADQAPSQPTPGAAPGSGSSALTPTGPPGSSTASSSGTSTPPVEVAVPSKLPQEPRKLGPGDIAIYLPASILRGSRPSASLTSATETVRFDIEMEAPVPSRVSVSVRAVPSTGEPLWSEAGVPTVRLRGGEHIASVHVPARVLPTGAIEVVVTTADKAWTPRVFPVLLRRD